MTPQLTKLPSQVRLGTRALFSPISRHLFRRWSIAAVAFWSGGATLFGAPLPFSVVSPDGDWKAAVVQKEIAPGISFELLVSHVGAQDRLVILSAPKKTAPAESLRTFAHRLKSSFNGYESADLTEKETTELGYSGLKLRFRMAKETNTFDCELFVFAVEQTWWGVLYAAPENTSLSSAAAFRVLRRDDPLLAGAVAMTPYVVKDVPISDFPIGFDVLRQGNRITEVIVNLVPPGSTTDRAGVKIGDAIVAINGRKVVDYATGVGKESEIGRIFLNRKPGDEVALEILPAGGKKVIKLTLRVSTALDRLMR